MVDWLLSPIDLQRVHEINELASWHGRFMVLAWGVLAPSGVLIARYFKITPRQNWPEQLDNPVWWYTHLGCQIAAVLLTFLAVGLALLSSGASTLILHSILGWSIVVLAALQLLSGIFRGSKGGPTESNLNGTLAGDHYDMTQRRVIFEWQHKLTGYALLVLAAFSLLSGLWRANALNWMWLAITLFWGALIASALVLQRLGHAKDTYQAIWGPDPSHPGNKIKPIGFGIHKSGPYYTPDRSNDKK